MIEDDETSRNIFWQTIRNRRPFRIQIDQDQGPFGERHNARYDRPVELQHDRARPNALQRQTLEAHSSPL
jgi:hypothetical protein